MKAKIYGVRYKIEAEVDVAAKSRAEVEMVIGSFKVGKMVGDLIGDYIPGSLKILTIKEKEL
jgi:hypothetical protein